MALKDTRAYWVYEMFVRLADELGAELTSLTMLRHPTEVVRSRDTAYLSGQSETFRRERETTNVAAWMNSVFETERVTRHHARAWVRYPDLRSDWREAMGRAGRQLGLTYNADLSSGEHHPVDDFIDSGLFRSRVTWDDIEVAPVLRDLADQVWESVNVLVERPHDDAAVAELERLRKEYVDLYAFASAMSQDERTAQLVAVRREMRGKLDQKQARIDELRTKLEQSRTQDAPLDGWRRARAGSRCSSGWSADCAALGASAPRAPRWAGSARRSPPPGGPPGPSPSRSRDGRPGRRRPAGAAARSRAPGRRWWSPGRRSCSRCSAS